MIIDLTLDEPAGGLGPCCTALAAAIGRPLALEQALVRTG